MYKVFIDGKEGTTGLQIYDRLAARADINLITLPEQLRKDRDARRQCLNEADISFLCLPDAAAREAAAMIENPHARVIDASTAHRTSEGWVYGLPEISPQRREEISHAGRVANPGCYATGFIILVAPLVKGGIAGDDYPFVCHALSGYSGAGRKGIAEYENPQRDSALDSPRHYALGGKHKHIPEMMKECGLKLTPVFSPIICDYYCGMLLQKKYSADDIYKYFTEYYATQNLIKIVPPCDNPGYLPANKIVGTNELEICICGDGENIMLFSVFDNLGKGASGAAVQNMNIMLGLDERTSLV